MSELLTGTDRKVWARYKPESNGYIDYIVFSQDEGFNPNNFNWRILHVDRSQITLSGKEYVLVVWGMVYAIPSELMANSWNNVACFIDFQGISALGFNSSEKPLPQFTASEYNVFKIERAVQWWVAVIMVDEWYSLEHARRISSLHADNKVQWVMFVVVDSVTWIVQRMDLGDLIQISPPPSASHTGKITKNHEWKFNLDFIEPEYPKVTWYPD